MTQSPNTWHSTRRPSSGLLIINFILLLVLLVLTIWLAHLDLQPYNGLLALSIAVLKTLLVALIFMHLGFSTKVTWVFALAGVVWLGIFFALSLTDYISRGWAPRMDNISPAIEFIPPPPGIHSHPVVDQSENPGPPAHGSAG